jgi:hypothetical protein
MLEPTAPLSSPFWQACHELLNSLSSTTTTTTTSPPSPWRTTLHQQLTHTHQKDQGKASEALTYLLVTDQEAGPLVETLFRPGMFLLLNVIYIYLFIITLAHPPIQSPTPPAYTHTHIHTHTHTQSSSTSFRTSSTRPPPLHPPLPTPIPSPFSSSLRASSLHTHIFPL